MESASALDSFNGTVTGASSGRGEGRPWPEVRKRLNAMLRGWRNYFSYGTSSGRTKSGTTMWSGGYANFCVSGIVTRPREYGAFRPRKSLGVWPSNAWPGDDLRGL